MVLDLTPGEWIVWGDDPSAPQAPVALTVTGDAGATWELSSEGLPEPAWSVVLREGMDSDEEGVALGTQSGFVYLRAHDGPWMEIARHLPPVLSVSLGSWP